MVPPPPGETMAAPDSSSAASFLSPLTSPSVSVAQLAQEPLPAPSCRRPGLLCQPGGAGGRWAGGWVANQALGRTGLAGKGRGFSCPWGRRAHRWGFAARGAGPLLCDLSWLLTLSGPGLPADKRLPSW